MSIKFKIDDFDWQNLLSTDDREFSGFATALEEVNKKLSNTLVLEKFNPTDTLPEDGETVLVCEEEDGELYFATLTFESEYLNHGTGETHPAFRDFIGYKDIKDVKFWCRLPETDK